jgi:hypothetical protein
MSAVSWYTPVCFMRSFTQCPLLNTERVASVVRGVTARFWALAAQKSSSVVIINAAYEKPLERDLVARCMIIVYFKENFFTFLRQKKTAQDKHFSNFVGYNVH